MYLSHLNMIAFTSSQSITSNVYYSSSRPQNVCHISTKSKFSSHVSISSLLRSSFIQKSLPNLTLHDQTRPTSSSSSSFKKKSIVSNATSTSIVQSVTKALDTITNLFPFWVFLGAIAAIIHPPTFLWFRPSFIVPTLAVIMLGMGLTISPTSFAAVARSPRRVLLGVCAQYTLMPLLARTLASIFSLPPAIAAGFILVGVCPGGAASNVVCLLAGADVALSVVLTLISTLLSVICIPSLMSLLAGTLVPVSPLALFRSTAQVVLLPLLFGALSKRLFPKIVDAICRILPLVSVLGIVSICGAVVAANASSLFQIGPKLVLAVGILHATGGFVGYIIARIFKFPIQSARTISIEVMMQNSSLAVSLANAHFAHPLTAVPGAISATMHSVFGSIIAGWWRFVDLRKMEVEKQNKVKVSETTV